MSVKVKICGIKNLDIALTSIQAGADFLGFNFVHTSRNYIDPDKAKKIIEALPRHPDPAQPEKDLKIVGVFQNEALEKVNQIASDLKLDYVQLHGNENLEYSKNIDSPKIKVFSLPEKFETDDVLVKMGEYNTDYFMVDRLKQGVGQNLDPQIVRILASKFPIFLAGGLTPENVAELVEIIRPFAVDVSSGVETEKVKDLEKIKQFIKNAKGVLNV